MLRHPEAAAATTDDPHNYYNMTDLLEAKDRLCVSLQSLLKEYEMYPNDIVIDSVDVDAEHLPPKRDQWANAALVWARGRVGTIFTVLALNYVLLGGGSCSGTLLGFVVSMALYVAYERRREAVAAKAAPGRATVTVNFNQMSQMYSRRDTLDAIMAFLDGPGAFDYGFSTIDDKHFYIRWVPPKSHTEWEGFARPGRFQRYAVAPFTVACLLIMAWAAMFLWRHWYGYSRPMDGVRRVSRHYFEGTPLAFLLLFL